jgi:mevalonate kinase
VRRRREAEPEVYSQLFDQIGAITTLVRALLADGNIAALGSLLTQNQELLQLIGVSSVELDRLVGAALGAGALGAKLSGAGWGGVMIALAQEDTIQRVQQALQAAGAVRVLATRIERC